MERMALPSRLFVLRSLLHGKTHWTAIKNLARDQVAQLWNTSSRSNLVRGGGRRKKKSQTTRILPRKQGFLLPPQQHDLIALLATTFRAGNTRTSSLRAGFSGVTAG